MKEGFRNQRLWNKACFAPTVHSKHLRRQCPHCRRKTHSIWKCPKVKYLDEKCTSLARSLIPKQLVKLQEIIDENFCCPLNDEQIPAALDLILKIMEDIIIRDRECGDLVQKESYSLVNDDYNEQSDIEYDYGAEARKAQKPQDKSESHRKETSQYLSKNEEEERIKNEESDLTKLLQELLIVYNALFKEMDKKKEEIVERNAILELKDLVVNLSKDASEEILTGEENMDRTIRFYQSAEIDHGNKRKEIEKDKTVIYLDSFKTFEVNDEETWKTEKDEKYGNERKDGLKVSASKPGKSCLKHGKGRVKDDNNGEVITEMKGLNCTIYGGDGIEKANEVNDIVNKEWEEHELNDVAKDEGKLVAEMDNAIYSKFDQKEKKEMDSIPNESGEIISSKTLEFLLGIVEKSFCSISCQNYFLMTQEEEAVYLGVLDTYYDLDEPVEVPLVDAEFGPNEKQENGLKVLLKEVATECDALVRKLAPREKEPIQKPGSEINVRNNKNEEVKVEMELDPSEETKEEKIEITNEIIIVKINCEKKTEVENKPSEIRSADGTYTVGSCCGKENGDEDKKTKVEVDKEVHDYLRDSAHMNGSMKNVVEINKVEYHCQNMSRVIRDETYGWRMGSAEGANSTGKFDPGGFWRRKPQRKRIEEETLEENNDNNDEEKGNGTEKFLKEKALSLACEKWIVKVSKFRNTVYEAKEPVEVIETLYVGDCYQNKFRDDEVRNNKINALFPYRKFAKMKLAEKMHNVDSCFDYEIGGSKISVEVSELEYAFWYRLTKEETPTSSWQYNNGNCYEGDKEHRLTNQSLSDIDAINRPYDLEPCYKGKSRVEINKCRVSANYKSQQIKIL
ncbi:hypothetical protein C2G38_2035016 [Gigaspora rosea]|uniref:Uncharacterized protein n=1 Tax=Gigaspora rosea TaxID=44941 RepID=A0A397VFY1_9GLOM|nr:hypothetical protein C2G38_2035016 [Gigaspora rosea]